MIAGASVVLIFLFIGLSIALYSGMSAGSGASGAGGGDESVGGVAMAHSSPSATPRSVEDGAAEPSSSPSPEIPDYEVISESSQPGVIVGGRQTLGLSVNVSIDPEGAYPDISEFMDDASLIASDIAVDTQAEYDFVKVFLGYGGSFEGSATIAHTAEGAFATGVPEGQYSIEMR